MHPIAVELDSPSTKHELPKQSYLHASQTPNNNNNKNILPSTRPYPGPAGQGQGSVVGHRKVIPPSQKGISPTQSNIIYNNNNNSPPSRLSPVTTPPSGPGHRKVTPSPPQSHVYQEPKRETGLNITSQAQSRSFKKLQNLIDSGEGKCCQSLNTIKFPFTCRPTWT